MRAAVLLTALLCTAACASMGAAGAAPAPAKPVEAPRFYSGIWYEIGRRPMALTDGCVAGATRFTLLPDNQLKVLDLCHAGSPEGAIKTIGGPAHIVDPGTNARFHVSYRLFGFIPVPKDYQVLDHADDYAWFISADPTFHDLWIYTRAPNPSPALVSELVEKAKALGYDTTRLEFPTQGHGEP